MADAQVPPLGSVVDDVVAAKNAEIRSLFDELAAAKKVAAQVSEELNQFRADFDTLKSAYKRQGDVFGRARDQIAGWMNAAVAAREAITKDPVPTGTTRGDAHKGEFSPQCVRALETAIAQMRDIVAAQ
jgi:hypothetical protein